jgi:hypothetical protein
MKFNFKHIKDAVAHMGYDINDAGVDAIVDLEVVTEDPGAGVLVDCVRVSISYTKPATTYSSSSHVTKSLEIYSDAAKQKPRYSETKYSEIK